MQQPLKHVESLFAFMINAAAAIFVVGAVLSLIRFVEAAVTYLGFSSGYHLPDGLCLTIGAIVALYATWKVNGRFVVRGG